MTARKIIGVTAALVTLAFAQVASAHHVVVSGEPECLSKQGIWRVLWTIDNLQNQDMVVIASNRETITLNRPVDDWVRFVDRFNGSRDSATLRVTVQWVDDGVTGKAQTTIDFPGTCEKPPPPDRATSAKLEGPCGDPMYRAVFKTFGATGTTTFRWSYIAFGVGRVTLVKTIAPDKVFRTGYKHVAGGTGTWVSAHGERLLYQITAPPGTYRPCS